MAPFLAWMAIFSAVWSRSRRSHSWSCSVRAVRREVLPRRGLAFSSVGVAIIGSVMYLAGRVLQCWLADPGRDFEGIRVTVGFYLDGVGRMVLATCLLVGGISVIRRHLGS